MTPIDLPTRTTPTGKLDWRPLLKWLRDDKVYSFKCARSIRVRRH